MATIAEALAQAARCYQAGDYPGAARLCRQILEVDPARADAECLLGGTYLALGSRAEAVKAYGRAVRLRPDDPLNHQGLGNALAALGRWSEAVASFRQAAQLDPSSAQAHDTLGLALREQGDLNEARASLERAIGLNPNAPGTHNNLGLVLKELGKPEEAAASFQQALRLLPDSFVVHNNLGTLLKEQGKLEVAEASFRQVLQLRLDLPEAHNNLGLVLLELDRPEEAEALFRQAIRLKPDYADACNNLGLALKERRRFADALASIELAVRLEPGSSVMRNNFGMVLKELGRLDEAAAEFRHSIRMQPGRAEVHDNLGLVLREQGEIAEAESHIREAIRLDPGYPDAHSNLGLVLAEQGRLDEALPCFERAIRLKPDLANAHYNLGQHLLRQGEFERGWEEYEWRWRVKTNEPYRHSFSQPLWDGSRLDGQTILLHAEQGLGDAFQFVRYATMVRQRGGTVLLECAGELHKVLGRCAGVDRLLVRGFPLPDFDVHAPLMSLPRIFGTRLDSIPAEVPYLTADAGLIAHWRQVLATLEGPKVGIAWQGNPRYAADALRSIPLERFGALARVQGVHLISLQKGLGSEQIPAFATRYTINDLGGRLDEASGPFMDTAAVMMNLDLVVTSDTSTAHLAGALGVPVWVALPFVADSRWLLGRDDSPWYPTMRLFRQSRQGDWEGVFNRIASALRATHIK